MTKKDICEFCGSEFDKERKNSIGRFCSSLCNRKVLRKNQLIRYEKYLSRETEEQKIQWLKKHYEKFVVKKDNDCWEWSGSKVCGYANFNHRGKVIKAHRASWVIYNGPIPKNIFVLHKCDIRHCSNPEHLFLGDQSDNMKDMASKGRTKITYRLTQENINEIRQLLSLGVPMSKLAKKYNVSGNAIFGIKHGITWKNK